MYRVLEFTSKPSGVAVTQFEMSLVLLTVSMAVLTSLESVVYPSSDFDERNGLTTVIKKIW